MKKKVITREIAYEANSALRYLEEERLNDASLDYNNQQHKHEDYQILIITKGESRGFIGETLRQYACGDIIVIGRNVPHYYMFGGSKEMSSAESCEIEILHFKHELFPVKMEEVSEFHFIYSLLIRSQNGIVFRNNVLFKKIRMMFNKIDDINGIAKLNELYLILDTLGKNKHYDLISSEAYDPDNTLMPSGSTLHKVYNYLYKKFRDEITLGEIAKYAHQNPTALCRTFKRETGKTIFQFLNKIRVENACKLLLETDMSISQVAYESGFTNLPHFNNQFRALIGRTPTEYRS